MFFTKRSAKLALIVGALLAAPLGASAEWRSVGTMDQQRNPLDTNRCNYRVSASDEYRVPITAHTNFVRIGRDSSGNAVNHALYMGFPVRNLDIGLRNLAVRPGEIDIAQAHRQAPHDARNFELLVSTNGYHAFGGSVAIEYEYTGADVRPQFGRVELQPAKFELEEQCSNQTARRVVPSR